MTKRDLKRFDALRRIGCIACRLSGVFSQADIHHVLSGGRRKGHQATIPLCPWHHRGVPPTPGYTAEDDTRLRGPSLAHGSKPFHAKFGTQQELLAKVNKMIKSCA